MGLFKKFFEKISSSAAKESDWEELTQELLKSDLGRELTNNLIDVGRSSRLAPVEAITERLHQLLSNKDRSTKPGIILVVGVNGTGKTTSVAKLAKQLPGSTILAAADTFRAAAVAQLRTWAERLEIPIITGAENSDPASVAFDATKRFIDSGATNLIIDTAGRLHNKSDLMAELEKIRRVVEKSAPISEVLLVIDATTGQNGLTQAAVFADAVAVTGVILTKLDGSARGGIALAIEERFGIPIKWVGTGESVDDFAPFDAQGYLQGLLG